MRTIAFVSESGGSGKSTIASSLAAAAHETSDKVCVIDMDPQGSLMNWARIRALRDPECGSRKSGTRFFAKEPREIKDSRACCDSIESPQALTVVACGAARLPAVLASLEDMGVTLAILDTPGAEGAASSAAMRIADLNIVPSRPSLFDLRASARARAALEEIGVEFVFLLNQRPPGAQTARVQDCVEALAELGELITPHILTRADYQEAARRGWGVTDFNPSGAAAQEMRALWQSIGARLACAKIRRPARKAA